MDKEQFEKDSTEALRKALDLIINAYHKHGHRGVEVAVLIDTDKSGCGMLAVNEDNGVMEMHHAFKSFRRTLNQNETRMIKMALENERKPTQDADQIVKAALYEVMNKKDKQ